MNLAGIILLHFRAIELIFSNNPFDIHEHLTKPLANNWSLLNLIILCLYFRVTYL